jgi:predicted nucleic acid-binding protein
VIVVDANVLVALIMGGERAPAARRALASDPDWAAPVLWRSELRNALLQYVRRAGMSQGDGVLAFVDAEAIIGDNEFDVDTPTVLSLAASSGCSAYDCEYVALARHFGVPLVTTDRALVKAFPGIAVSLEAFTRR